MCVRFVACVLIIGSIAACDSSGSASSSDRDAQQSSDDASVDENPGRDARVGGDLHDGGLVTYGEEYAGGEFHLGPVDYEESEWHNACAPGTKYAPAIREMQGDLLAGLWNGISNVAGYCDACIHVRTAMGKSALLRVVTYGATSENSIDVSPEAFDILNSGEYPRTMSWRFAKCPDTGNVVYEFHEGSHQYWTSFWVRNARVPLERVEMRSESGGTFVELVRNGDGTLTRPDNQGFGANAFTIRLTAIDGQQMADTYDWPGDIGGMRLTAGGNFE